MKRAFLLLAVLYTALVGGCAAPATANSLPLKTLGDVPLDGGASRFDYQAIDPASGRLYIAHLGASQVIVYDLAAQKVIKDIPDVASVHGLLAVPVLGRIYASATGDNQVAVIDAGSLAVVKRIPVGQYPDGLAYDPDTQQLYVSDETGRTVSVVDARTDTFVRDIQTTRPTTSWWPSTRYSKRSARATTCPAARGRMGSRSTRPPTTRS